jgi:uncharacterized protein (TIRG00374 family)
MPEPDHRPADPEAQEEEDRLDVEPSFFQDRRRLIQSVVVVLLLVVAIYVLVPQLVGVEDGIERLGRGHNGWIALAFGFSVLMFFSYVALFRGVVGEQVVHLNWRESYEITMAGLAMTRIFSAGGAGGIVLTYWALRKAGLTRRESAARMVAFLVLLYTVYMATLVLDGILLRTGVFSGPAPLWLTIVPAAVAAGVIVVFLLLALIPGDVERRLASASPETLLGRIGVRLAMVPATTAKGTRLAMRFVARPRRGAMALLGAVGFWASNIAILWASFKAFDVDVSGAVVVQGFFVGMAANLIPAPSGVGPVDAGMIGTFVLFGLPSSGVIAAVLVYRLIAFWLPIPPGIIAFFQLRRTVRRWEEQQELPAEAAEHERRPAEEPRLSLHFKK